MTRRHRISVMATIHQPNTELLMMFDTVYTLDRSGVCVYSGRPQDLRLHLNQCNITCAESEFPIEVMLTILSNDDNKADQHLNCLRKRTNESQGFLIDIICKQTELIRKPIWLSSKTFKMIDFLILVKRMAHCLYVCNWKSLLAQFSLIQMSALVPMMTYTSDKIHSKACLHSNTLTNETCLMSATDWTEESNIFETINYNFSILNFAMFFQLVVTTLTYSSDVQLFTREHRNGKNYNKSLIKIIILIRVYYMRF